MKTLTELKDGFQALVTSPSPDPVKLWELYAEWDAASQRERGSKLPHAQIVLYAVQRREHLDSGIASLGVFGLSLATIDFKGRTGRLFEGMDSDTVELAKPVIERMVSVAYNPRSLNPDNI